MSSCRDFGSGVVGPIPWDRILLYSSVHGLDTDMTRVFEDVIREMDEEYLRHQREDMKRKLGNT